MKTKILLLICLIAMGFVSPPGLNAAAKLDTAALIMEDSINARSLIISEMGSDWRGFNEWAYVEFANTGDKTLDLSSFFIWYPSWADWYQALILDGYETDNKMRLFGSLEPNETFVLVQRERNLSEDPYGDLNYPNGYTNFEADRIADKVIKRWGAPLTDPTVIEKEILGLHLGLGYKNMITEFEDTIFPDSIFVDRFGVVNSESNVVYGHSDYPIAGIQSDQPFRARIYVRKFQVKQGNVIPKNPGDPYNDTHVSKWNESRGTDISDSEWLPLPRSMDREYDKIFTTIGRHSDNPEYSVSSTTAGVSIDTDGEMITMPFGVSRDSVFRMFETGLNHAWELKLGADTGQFFIQPDDSIFFYTVGSELITKKYGVSITKDANKVALVAPLVYKNENDVFTRQFDISSGEEPMDTIGTLPFDMPVDSFFAYMVKEEGAKWDIKPADGVKRPDIKEGDILEVTAADGSIKKEYYLGVQQFFPSHNANLSTIYMPGLQNWENPETYELTDTLIGFNPSGTLYAINLPSDIAISPAIVASKEDSRSNVVIQRAKDLKGSEADRTALITVTAEDDTTIKVYKLIFNVEREAPPVKGDLFITDVATGWSATNQNHNIQFYNPNDDVVDLADYVFVSYQLNNFNNIANAYQNDSNWIDNNKHILRFGSIVEPAEDGTPVYKSDFVQTKTTLEANEVFSMSTRGGYGPRTLTPEEGVNNVDLVIGHTNKSDFGSWWSNGWIAFAEQKYGTTDPWGTGFMPLSNVGNSTTFRNYSKSWGTTWFGLARIMNDSVKDGIKHVFGDFDQDYEWVDQFGGPSRTTDQKFYIFENDSFIACGDHKGLDAGMYRKPNVYKGNPIESQSFGVADSETNKTLIPSEWVFYGVDFNDPNPATRVTVKDNPEGTGLNNIRDARIKKHTMITYAHISYLTSSVYLMDEGLTGQQNIAGVTAGTTVAQFLGNVNKSDLGMVVKVFGADGSEVSDSDPIAVGTNVWSWSASGLDSVNYIVSVLGPLDNNCTLSSSDYTVVKDGNSGSVSGIALGISLENLQLKLSAPATATLLFTDGKDQNYPLYKFSADTNAINEKTMSAVLASENIFVEVLAQDKVTKCVYSLVFNEESAPFILSDVYEIDADEKIINYVWRTSPKALLANLIASPGASVKVVNKYDQERTLGIVSYSDRVIVTKGDVSVSYWMNFSSEDGVIGVNVEDVKEVGMSIYPNPTTDFVTINGFTGKYFEIRDIAGKIILKQTINSDQAIKLDLRKLDSGIYIITDTKTSYKVIKN